MESDQDYPDDPIHGSDGPLCVSNARAFDMTHRNGAMWADGDMMTAQRDKGRR